MDIDDEQHDTRSPLILQHDNENHQSIGTMIIWVINGMQPLIRLFFIICCPQRMWQRILLKLNRKYSNRCLILLFIILLAIALIFMNLSLKSLTQPLKSSRDSYIIYKCKNINGSKPNDHSSRLNEVPDSQKMTVEPKVLVLTDTQHSKLGQSILEVLVANRIQYKTQVIGKSLPILTNLARAKYGAIVFENAERYLAMDQWNRELLDKYLIKYKVGMIGFFPTFSKVTIQKLRGLPLFVQELSSVVNVTLNAGNPVLRLTKAGEMLSSAPNSNWTGFISSHPSYMPLEWGLSPNSDGTYAKKCLAMLDSGTIDGVERIFFGAGLEFWLHRLLFLDAISYLSRGRLSVSLERYVLVDIDDIFVAPRGNKMVPDDVEALVAAQKRIKKVIPGFKFNLGFSGKYFRKGNPQEQLGDEHLLNFVPEFQWFGHMWRHIQPHLIVSVSKLFDSMKMNKDFAEKHGIPTDSGYSVAPHHSGVYPIHEPLYDAWKRVWNVRVTSTEEYPHLRPSRLRRGFIHRNIMVLPRQTCGLYTHTNFLNSYPGGPENFYSSVLGGEFFQTVVFNPISVFMTHQSNYALDRLGLYAFESVFEFIHCWTNVKISTAPPLQLAEMYFEMFPEEANPIWGNPCLDKRHMSIWATNKTCDRLPKILIVGPQKTGTTALYSFLSMHPSIRSNEPSPETYEEIQFFNGKNYFRGIDWYMNFFPFVSNSSLNLFEKSATYFDGELVPKRVKALLPKAHMIVIVIRPEKRAYSWYHHMRAHNDRAASAYSFYDVITADANSPKALRDLRNRCLNPGLYAKNLERWLLYFPASQIEIIDGEELRSDPVKIMTDLQTSLALSPTFDYSEHLQFNRRKGFYCQVTKGEKTKCLGRGKGRQYPVMEAREEKILKDFYKQQNVAFEKLLLKMNRPVPSWLSQELQ